MRTPYETPGHALAHPLVKLSVGVIGLLLLQQIAIALPVLHELVIPGLHLAPVDLARLLVLTGVLAVILITGGEFSGRLRASYPGFPELSQLARLLALLVVAGMAYRVYLPVAVPLLGESLAVYQVVMLALVAVPLVAFALTFFANLGKLALMVLDGFRSLLRVEPSLRCVECGGFAPPGAGFCPRCGQSLAG